MSDQQDSEPQRKSTGKYVIAVVFVIISLTVVWLIVIPYTDNGYAALDVLLAAGVLTFVVVTIMMWSEELAVRRGQIRETRKEKKGKSKS